MAACVTHPSHVRPCRSPAQASPATPSSRPAAAAAALGAPGPMRATPRPTGLLSCTLTLGAARRRQSARWLAARRAPRASVCGRWSATASAAPLSSGTCSWGPCWDLAALGACTEVSAACVCHGAPAARNSEQGRTSSRSPSCLPAVPHSARSNLARRTGGGQGGGKHACGAGLSQGPAHGGGAGARFESSRAHRQDVRVRHVRGAGEAPGCTF